MIENEKNLTAAELITQALGKKGVVMGKAHSGEVKTVNLGIAGNYHTMKTTLSQIDIEKTIWDVMMENGYTAIPPVPVPFVPRLYWKDTQSITVVVYPSIATALPLLIMTEFTPHHKSAVA